MVLFIIFIGLLIGFVFFMLVDDGERVGYIIMVFFIFVFFFDMIFFNLFYIEFDGIGSLFFNCYGLFFVCFYCGDYFNVENL